MNQSWKMAGVAALAVVMAGCSVTGGDLIRPGEPTATLIIINGSYNNLNAVVISDCNNFTYGLNRLDSGDYIAPGEARSFTLSAGCWDVGGGSFVGGEAYERMTLGAGDIMRYTITN